MRNLVVSVVIATYNRAKLLADAVHSILAQTYQDFEVILVDDCSTDDTSPVIRELCSSDSRIRSFRTLQNIGPGAARNLGIANALGEFVAILDDDDTAVPERLEIQLDMLRAHKEVDLVFSPVRWIDDEGKEIDIFPGRAANGTFPGEPADVFRLLYLESNKIPNTTLCFRRILFAGSKMTDGRQTVYSYPAEPRVGEDWFLMMQMAATGVRMVSYRKPLVLQRRGRTHDSLMKKTAYAYSSQRQILRMIRSWLREEEIYDFEALHRLAYSNQLSREAQGWGGRIGIGLCLLGALYSPQNPQPYRTFSRLAGKAFSRLRLAIQT